MIETVVAPTDHVQCDKLINDIDASTIPEQFLTTWKATNRNLSHGTSKGRWSPLAAAALQGNTKLIEAILKTAQSDAEKKALLEGRNWLHWTPLYAAVQNNQYHAARLLLENDANPKVENRIPDKQKGELHQGYAINPITDEPEILRGVNPITGKPDDETHSPLWVAYKCQNQSMIRLLKQNGAKFSQAEEEHQQHIEDQAQLDHAATWDFNGQEEEHEALSKSDNNQSPEDNSDLTAEDQFKIPTKKTQLYPTTLSPQNSEAARIAYPICLGVAMVAFTILSFIPMTRIAGALGLRSLSALALVTARNRDKTEGVALRFFKLSAVGLAVAALVASIPLLMIPSIAIDLATQIWGLILSARKERFSEVTLQCFFILIDVFVLAGLIMGSWQLMITAMSLACVALLVAACLACHQRSWVAFTFYMPLCLAFIAGTITSGELKNWHVGEKDRHDFQPATPTPAEVVQSPIAVSSFPALPVGEVAMGPVTPLLGEILPLENIYPTKKAPRKQLDAWKLFQKMKADINSKTKFVHLEKGISLLTLLKEKSTTNIANYMDSFLEKSVELGNIELAKALIKKMKDWKIRIRVESLAYIAISKNNTALLEELLKHTTNQSFFKELVYFAVEKNKLDFAEILMNKFSAKNYGNKISLISLAANQNKNKDMVKLLIRTENKALLSHEKFTTEGERIFHEANREIATEGSTKPNNSQP